MHSALNYLARAPLSALAISFVVAMPAQAGPFDPPPVADGVAVSLIQQDSSDCTNTTVQDDPNRTRGGEVWATATGGTTTVQVALTASPNTAYDFYLKCQQPLGVIQTDDEGIGLSSFTFPSTLVGKTFAFDVYPSGAPPGNKFQSLTVNMP